MIKIKFANNEELELVDSVISEVDSNAGETRDSFIFQVRAKDIAFSSLTSLLIPANTETIILTNTDIMQVDEKGEATQNPVSEAYYGYIDLTEITYCRRTIQQGLLNMPTIYEWVYNVKLSEQTNSQKQFTTIQSILNQVPDDSASDLVDAFPEWSTMGEYDGLKYTGRYSLGYRVRYRELLYKCIQGHLLDPRQLDWNPADAKSLWKKISEPTDVWPTWVQPTGAHDAYDVGDKVTYNNRQYISIANANVWAPGVYGWEEVV